jgi:hypothetical protein
VRLSTVKRTIISFKLSKVMDIRFTASQPWRDARWDEARSIVSGLSTHDHDARQLKSTKLLMRWKDPHDLAQLRWKYSSAPAPTITRCPNVEGRFIVTEAGGAVQLFPPYDNHRVPLSPISHPSQERKAPFHRSMEWCARLMKLANILWYSFYQQMTNG